MLFCHINIHIAPDMTDIKVNKLLIFKGYICCGYSLKLPCDGTSNEYPSYRFSWRNNEKTNTFWLKKKTTNKKLLTGAMNSVKIEVFVWVWV